MANFFDFVFLEDELDRDWSFFKGFKFCKEIGYVLNLIVFEIYFLKLC